VDQSFATSAPTPTSVLVSGRRSYSPTVVDDDDPFAAPVASARDRRPEEAAVEGDARGEPRARKGELILGLVLRCLLLGGRRRPWLHWRLTRQRPIILIHHQFRPPPTNMISLVPDNIAGTRSLPGESWN